MLIARIDGQALTKNIQRHLIVAFCLACQKLLNYSAILQSNLKIASMKQNKEHSLTLILTIRHTLTHTHNFTYHF